MVAYKLSKNGWVMPFFVIFRLAREKLLVTVALDHPVVQLVVKDLGARRQDVRCISRYKQCTVSGAEKMMRMKNKGEWKQIQALCNVQGSKAPIL